MASLPYAENDYAFNLYMLLENTLELFFILCIRFVRRRFFTSLWFFLFFQTLIWLKFAVYGFLINDISKASQKFMFVLLTQNALTQEKRNFFSILFLLQYFFFCLFNSSFFLSNFFFFFFFCWFFFFSITHKHQFYDNYSNLPS